MITYELRKDVQMPNGFWRAGIRKTAEEWNELWPNAIPTWGNNEWFIRIDPNVPNPLPDPVDMPVRIVTGMFKAHQLHSITYKQVAIKACIAYGEHIRKKMGKELALTQKWIDVAGSMAEKAVGLQNQLDNIRPMLDELTVEHNKMFEANREKVRQLANYETEIKRLEDVANDLNADIRECHIKYNQLQELIRSESVYQLLRSGVKSPSQLNTNCDKYHELYDLCLRLRINNEKVSTEK
jgi:hypothetical protein